VARLDAFDGQAYTSKKNDANIIANALSFHLRMVMFFLWELDAISTVIRDYHYLDVLKICDAKVQSEIS